MSRACNTPATSHSFHRCHCSAPQSGRVARGGGMGAGLCCPQIALSPRLSPLAWAAQSQPEVSEARHTLWQSSHTRSVGLCCPKKALSSRLSPLACLRGQQGVNTHISPFTQAADYVNDRASSIRQLPGDQSRSDLWSPEKKIPTP